MSKNVAFLNNWNSERKVRRAAGADQAALSGLRLAAL